MATKPEKEFLGSGVSPGVVFGQALKLDKRNRAILKMSVDNIEEEVRRLLNAIEQSKTQLALLKSRLEEKSAASTA